jgi:hypothetical protein
MLKDPAPMPVEIAVMAQRVTHSLTAHGADTDIDNTYPSDRQLPTRTRSTVDWAYFGSAAAIALLG